MENTNTTNQDGELKKENCPFLKRYVETHGTLPSEEEVKKRAENPGKCPFLISLRNATKILREKNH